MMQNGFGDPWEHVRLLSDATRNEAMVSLLRHRAPGSRVLETGCGTGLLSCIAARLGARRVIAVEPTGQAEVARQLVADNQLGDIVTVVQANIEALEPERVDLAFSELLNADPFLEGVVEAADHSARWLGPTGLLAPRRLRVYAALARANGSARELRDARAEVARLGASVGLRTDIVTEALTTPRPYQSITSTEQAAGPATLVWDLQLGRGERPEARSITLTATDAGPVGGVLVWFEAELDDGLILANPPEDEGHWGTQLYSFGTERGLRAGASIELGVSVVDRRVELTGF